LSLETACYRLLTILLSSRLLFLLFLEHSPTLLEHQDSELEPLLEKCGIHPEEWTPLLIAMEDLLFNSSGLLNFSNEDVRSAVKKRHLALTPQAKLLIGGS